MKEKKHNNKVKSRLTKEELHGMKEELHRMEEPFLSQDEVENLLRKKGTIKGSKRRQIK